ncbi:MAG TPA: AraC family transcriptional regulator, partial [Terrimicrobiaceae bacterium]|nr:AraC family transcriptional regulator [Terrimicrobiaceae bacterium]
SGRQPLASEKYRHRRSQTIGSRLERVTAYLEEHFREDLPLAEAARVAGLTPGAFSKFFRKMTRKTFVDYRNSLRIREACRALAESDRPVTEIAYACGFSNLANFNRRFLRETGVVPRDFRRTFNPPA